MLKRKKTVKAPYSVCVSGDLGFSVSLLEVCVCQFVEAYVEACVEVCGSVCGLSVCGGVCGMCQYVEVCVSVCGGVCQFVEVCVSLWRCVWWWSRWGASPGALCVPGRAAEGAALETRCWRRPSRSRGWCTSSDWPTA